MDDIFKKDFINEVKNDADLFPVVNEEIPVFDIEHIIEKYWKYVKNSDSRDWYKLGTMIGDYIPSNSGKELLSSIIKIHNDIIKEFLRKSNYPLDKNVTLLMNSIDNLSKILYDQTLDAVKKEDGNLTDDDVLAYFQGYLNKKYKQSVNKNT